MDTTPELTDAEKFAMPRNDQEIFFDLLLACSPSTRNRDPEIARRNTKIFCKYYGINGDKTYHTKAKLAEEFNISAIMISSILDQIWRKLVKKDSPITKENIREKFSLPLKPRGKHAK